jgi:hypothetical protein
MQDVAPVLVRPTAWREQTLASLLTTGYPLASARPQHRVEVPAHSCGSQNDVLRTKSPFTWEQSRAQVIRHGAHGHEGD